MDANESQMRRKQEGIDRELVKLDIAGELDKAGWPSVADDVREGVPPAMVLDRLRKIGEGDSSAAEILSSAIS